MTMLRNITPLSHPKLPLHARNSLLNFSGNVLPLVAALVVIPQLVHGLGTERFGVLSLVWMVIGYFGLFDLGIGRATTKFVAEYLATDDKDLLRDTVWTSLVTLTSFGLVGGIVLATLNYTLVLHVLHIPLYLHEETSGAFYVLALSIPLVLATAGFRGILEAHRRFGVINSIKIPVGVASIVAPLLVLPFSLDLTHIAAALLSCRVIELMATVIACRKEVFGLGQPQWPQREHLRKLLGYGGWLTVTNIVGPLMTYLDRIIVGLVLSMSAVAYYSTPYDVITKQGIVPASLLGAVFPNLCGYAAIDMDSFVALYEKSVTCIIAIMAPAAIILTVLAEPLLNLWLGQLFAEKSTIVVQILALGVFLNSVAQAPYVAIQSLGRADITAKLHIIELPFYLLLLLISVSQFGINGAALAWLIRVVIDTGILFWISGRMLPARSNRTRSLVVAVACLSVLLLASAFLTTTVLVNIVPKILYLLGSIAAMAVLFWQFSSLLKPSADDQQSIDSTHIPLDKGNDNSSKKLANHV